MIALDDHSKRLASRVNIIRKENSIEVTNAIGALIERIDLSLTSEKILRVNFYGYVTPEEIKELLGGDFLLSLAERECTGCLFDLTELEGSWLDVYNWLYEYFGLELYRLGARKSVSVLSKNMFSNMSMRYFVDELPIDYPLDIRYYDSISDALAWLRSDN